MRRSLVRGAALGALTSLPLIALFYLGQQFASLPFLPFDLFDWLARRLPGGIITIGIDSIVRAIGALRLGPISGSAKLIEQTLALALGPRRGNGDGSRAGSIGGFVLFVLAALAKYDLGFGGDPSLTLVWLAVLLMSWGALLGKLLAAAARPAANDAAPAGLGRRDALRLAGGSLALTLAAWGLGRLLQTERGATGAGRALAEVPTPAPPPPTGERLVVAPGTRPELTPNERFYRIDIDTRPPVIDGPSWSLQVAGLFDRPRALTLADLAAFPAVTQPITISCISNPVGGDLIGTSNWTGACLRDVLADLGLRPTARQLYVESVDGFYESVTMPDMLDERTLLVYAMNGTALPTEHGFPLRIYIPNRYGMKQPKWITRIEALDHAGPGYWPKRGWSQEARPQVISIVDAVATDAIVDGRVPVGGIAWAGDRGISRVEVQVDDGEWSAAALRTPTLGPLTWVQWRYDWPAQPGRHTFRVRAVDGAGTLQVGEPAPSAPNGATGYHAVTATI
jgi:DMSO/TMAO reductase YedYZ molybdopterin-dependent catalytic subunit